MRPLSSAEKDRMRFGLISVCRNQTGFQGDRHPEYGCSRRNASKPVLGMNFEIPYIEYTRCKCLETFSVMHRLGDFGFNPELFRHDPASIKVTDQRILNDYLSKPEEAWSGKGVFIHAEQIGCGKTTLAHFIAGYLYTWGLANKRVGSGEYPNWYMLSSEFADRAWRGRDGFKEKFVWGAEHGESLIDLWDARGVVVIDELGREDLNDAKTKAGRSALEAFLRHRYNYPTIVVSHIAPSNAVEFLNPQVVSLLSRMAVIEVVGEDKRKLDGNPFYKR